MKHTIQQANAGVFPVSFKHHQQQALWLMLVTAAFSLMLASCKKDKVLQSPDEQQNQSVNYIDLGNREIPFHGRGIAVNLIGDDRPELLFDLYRVGDPIEKADKWLWTVVTNSQTYLAIDPQNEIPVLNYGNSIPLQNFGEYDWFTANEGNLMVRKEKEDGSISWSGRWLNVAKKYVAVSPHSKAKDINAWIEISTNNTTQSLTIHRAGVSKVPDAAIPAGK